MRRAAMPTSTSPSTAMSVALRRRYAGEDHGRCRNRGRRHGGSQDALHLHFLLPYAGAIQRHADGRSSGPLLEANLNETFSAAFGCIRLHLTPRCLYMVRRLAPR
jgi:hypothetical protein